MEAYRHGVYASNPIRQHRGPDSSFLAVSHDGMIHLIDAVDISLLRSCRRVAKLETHSLYLKQLHPQLGHEEIDRRLQRLVASQLVSALGCVGPGEDKHVFSGISSCGIVTADRPGMLQRCVTSWESEIVRSSTSPDLMVVDNSQSQILEDRSRAACRSAKLNIRFIGRKERMLLVKELAAKSGAPTEVKFSLNAMPSSAGSNRNLLSLLAIGRNVFCVDDDVLSCPWRPRHHESGIRFGDDFAEHELSHFKGRDEVIDFIAKTRCNQSVIAAHAELIGRSAQQLIHAYGYSYASGPVSLPVPQDTSFSVRATMGGVAGDSGSRSHNFVLFSDKRSVQDGSDWDVALGSREVVRSPTAIALMRPTASYMALCTSLDCTKLLPPFFPMFRGEDNIFGALLAACEPSALLGHVPIGVIHASDRAPALETHVWPKNKRLPCASIILAVLAALTDRNDYGEANYSLLGSRLGVFASRPRDSFIVEILDILLEHYGREFTNLRSGLLDDHSSVSQRQARSDYQSALSSALASGPQFLVPKEYGNVDLARGVGALQLMLQSFASMLSAWPVIWKAASQLDLNDVLRSSYL